MKETESIGPNHTAIFIRISMIALGAFIMFTSLSIIGSDATVSENVVIALVSSLTFFLILVPPARGLLNWPIRLSFSMEKGIVSLESLIGRNTILQFDDILEMQPTDFWHGGRTSFEGLILQLKNGNRIRLSNGNIMSLQKIQEILISAGVRLVHRTSAGRALNP